MKNLIGLIIVLTLTLSFTKAQAQKSGEFGVNSHGVDAAIGYRGYEDDKNHFVNSLRNVDITAYHNWSMVGQNSNNTPNVLALRVGYQIWRFEPIIGVAYHYFSYTRVATKDETALTNGTYPMYGFEFALKDYKPTDEDIKEWMKIYVSYLRTNNIDYYSLGIRFYFK